MTPGATTATTATTATVTPSISSIGFTNSGPHPTASGIGPIFTTMPLNRVTLSEFLPANPTLWFILADKQFRTNKITDPDDMLSILCSKLPPDVLARASDILESNDTAENTLKKLKNRIVSLYSVSDEQKLDELLKNVSMGTKKPSVLLTEMRLLAGPCQNEDLLKRLWLRRLPPRMQELLAIQTVPLDSLATMADSVQNIMPMGSVASIAQPSTSSFSEPTFEQRMEARIEALTAQIAALSTQQSRGRTRDRSESRDRRPRSRTRSQNRPYCWYHFRFGTDARKCVPPCTFPSVPEGTNNAQGNQ